MSELNSFSEISLDINLDEKSEDYIFKDDYDLYPPNFEDFFFTNFKYNSKNIDNKSEIDNNDYIFKQNPNKENKLTNSNINFDDTKRKSNEESMKIEEKNAFGEYSMNKSEIVNYKNNKNINILFNIHHEKDSENNNLIINIDNTKNSEENHSILEKKNVFNVVYSNNLNIFTIGEYNKDIKKRIYDAFNDKNKESLFKVNNKKRKNNYKRKDNSDNIRKKIKARFIKALKNAVNEKLKSVGSLYFFNLLPQIFTTNLSKKVNKSVLDLTLKEIFSKNFVNNKKNKNADINKYNHNLVVLKYLENKKDICEKSQFNLIKDMKYSDIYKEYLISKEFEMEISTLIKEKESDKYIKDYINNARNFLNYFYH